jgi:hypothetical protein
MGFNYAYLIIAIVALYIGFNLGTIWTFLGFPDLGVWQPFLGLAFIFLAPVAMMKMAHIL